jgi:hypothetical protein
VQIAGSARRFRETVADRLVAASRGRQRSPRSRRFHAGGISAADKTTVQLASASGRPSRRASRDQPRSSTT